MQNNYQKRNPEQKKSMAEAHSRTYRQRSKLNSEVLAHQQAGAAEKKGACKTKRNLHA